MVTSFVTIKNFIQVVMMTMLLMKKKKMMMMMIRVCKKIWVMRCRQFRLFTNEHLREGFVHPQHVNIDMVPTAEGSAVMEMNQVFDKILQAAKIILANQILIDQSASNGNILEDAFNETISDNQHIQIKRENDEI